MNLPSISGDGFIRDGIWTELGLGPNALQFLERVYSAGLDKYEGRLRTLGIPGGMRALDAGCGVGQWSFSMASMCQEVYGVDVSFERMQACRKLSIGWGIRNAHFVHSALERLPFASASFDRTVCYSVLYQTYYERSLQELARVTQKGGLLYISTNDIGRFIQQIVDRPNRAPDFDPRAYGLATLRNTFLGRRHGLSPRTGGVVTRKARLLRLLGENGFQVIECAPEGRLMRGTEPFLSGSYLGLISTFDILARKSV